MTTPTEDISNFENDKRADRSMNSVVACDLFKRRFVQQQFSNSPILDKKKKIIIL